MKNTDDMLISIDFQDVAGDDARISVLDRGFLFGDSVYEVVRTYHGKLFQLPGHLERLERSARTVRFPFKVDGEAIGGEVRRLHQRWTEDPDRGEAQARIIVTRGEGRASIDPRDSENPRTIIIMRPLRSPPPQSYLEGISAAVVEVRRNLIEALPPSAKTGNYLNNILAILEAQALGAAEPIILDSRGRVAESATANIFIVRGNTLYTPGSEVGILGGLTRRALVELAPTHGWKVEEAILWPEDLKTADEILLTSTTREILPVTSVKVDGDFESVGSGSPGPVAKALLTDWRQWVTRLLDS